MASLDENKQDLDTVLKWKFTAGKGCAVVKGGAMEWEGAHPLRQVYFLALLNLHDKGDGDPFSF